MSVKETKLALLQGGAGEKDPTSALAAFGLPNEEDALMAFWHALGLVEKAIPSSPYFRVAIFGSAKILPSDPLYHDAKTLGYHSAKLGIDVITGGGPGIMEAANSGAMEGRGESGSRSIGLSIPMASEARANAFLSNEYLHHNFFTRLHHFARFGRVFVVMPGGIGTLLELAIIWQLLQRGHMRNIPLIVVGDMWLGLMDWMKATMVAQGYVTADEMELVVCVSKAEDAIPLLCAAHEQFKLLKAAG